MNEKVDARLQAGCQAVCLIDPARKTASIYVRCDGQTIKQSGESLAHEELLPGFELAVKDVFA